MKKITAKDIEIVKEELSLKRKEFEQLDLTLEEKLKWIQDFFNLYIPELEKRFITEEELKELVFLPNELRVWLYIYFPEHGLNMANYSQELVKELQKRKRFDINNLIAFRHQD